MRLGILGNESDSMTFRVHCGSRRNCRDSLASLLGPWVNNAGRELDVAAQLQRFKGLGVNRKPKKGTKKLQTGAEKPSKGQTDEGPRAIKLQVKSRAAVYGV